MKKFLLSCALLFLCTGCAFSTGTRSARGYLPAIEKPARPVLEEFTLADVAAYNAMPRETQQRVLRNNDSMQLYAAKLETAIDIYNGFARGINAETKTTLEGGK